MVVHTTRMGDIIVVVVTMKKVRIFIVRSRLLRKKGEVVVSRGIEVVVRAASLV